MSVKVFLILITVVSLKVQYVFCDTYSINVGIMVNVKKFQVMPEGSSKLLIETAEGKIKALQLTQPTTVNFVKEDKIKLLDKIYKLPVKFSSYEGKIRVNNRVYPGEIKVLVSTEGVTLVNIVDIERYLYGVVPYEISQNWTDEMLKVQSVIARTYAVLNLGRHKNEGFDLCSDVHCQVYKGLSKNMYTRVKKAVDATKGMVVVDEETNKPVQTYYHAACGGGTENVTDIWGGGIDSKHLLGVDCNYCASSPYSSWKCEIAQNKFVQLLETNGFFIGKTVKKIKIVSTTKKGRAKEVEIVGSDSLVTLRGEDLRKILGYNKLRSTKIKDVEVDKDKITFYGKGWGHGIGLCQWGANYLSQKGYKFDKIIKFYYPHVRIRKLY